MATVTSVSIRMYRHGLGDCFLLRFVRQGERPFNILIDCGIAMVAAKAKETMEKVVADLKETCPAGIDVVVMTHEHWDHASGFSTQQVQRQFDDIPIGQVWYAWTEDPKNELGKKLRKEREAKVSALHLAARALREEDSAFALERAHRIESLLQFFGLDAEALPAGETPIKKTRAAFEYLSKRSDVKVRYCHPQNAPIEVKGLEGIRVFVLGPPENERLIKRSDPTKSGREVYDFAADLAVDEHLGAAFGRLAGQTSIVDDRPFDPSWARAVPRPGSHLETLVEGTWNSEGMAFRKIDLDWTASAESLALDLDKHTNNTCLVLAFEHIASGKVLLFPADAQVGNWLSWQDCRWTVPANGGTQEVTGPDLLRRTVFYKVGHHGSHNATLRALGLEQMASDDLVAFVPVFEEQARKSRWKEMPFEPLVQRLGEKTGGRLVLSDEKVAAPKKTDLGGLTGNDAAAFLTALVGHPKKLYYEYTLALSQQSYEGVAMASQQPFPSPAPKPQRTSYGSGGVASQTRSGPRPGQPNDKMPVLVELKAGQTEAFMGFGFGAQVPFDIDASFAPVSMAQPSGSVAAAMSAVGVEPTPDTRVLRAFVRREELETITRQPGVVAVWADAEVAPIHVDCTPDVATGSSVDVASRLRIDQVWAAARTRGEGIVIGIVDGGVDGTRHPVSGGWSPDPTNPPGSPNVQWRGHGNMCAFDARIACPGAAIYDYAIGRTAGAIPAFLSGVLQAFQHALLTYRQHGYPHVLSNSWGLYEQSWDPFPPGHPSNYTHNLAHPLIRKVVEVMDAGILVAFAAGNCGDNCPDGRCREDVGPGRSIRGANGHPRVICVGAVNLQDNWIGYSSQGPSTLDPQKPDVCSFSHFAGETPSDSGTSAACPVVAGVLGLLAAAVPGITQDRVRSALQQTARGGQGVWQHDLGWGIVDALAAYQLPP